MAQGHLRTMSRSRCKLLNKSGTVLFTVGDAVGYCGRRNQSTFCREPDAFEGSVFKAFSESNYIFACLFHCKEFCLSNFWPPGLFNFFFFQIPFKHACKVTCVVSVHQTFIRTMMLCTDFWLWLNFVFRPPMIFVTDRASDIKNQTVAVQNELNPYMTPTPLDHVFVCWWQNPCFS